MENFLLEPEIKMCLSDECLEKMREELEQNNHPEAIDISGLLDEGVQDEESINC